MVDNSLSKNEMVFSEGKWKLRIAAKDSVNTITLNKSEFCIGRSSEADIHIDDNRISRKHAKLYFESGCWWLQDLDSSNGIYVEGRRVKKAKIVAEGRFKIGSVMFTLQGKDGSPKVTKTEKTTNKSLGKKGVILVLLGVLVVVGVSFAVIMKKTQSDRSVQVVTPLQSVETKPEPKPIEEASGKDRNSGEGSSSAEERIVKKEEDEGTKQKTKELYRAGLLFYDNGNLKRAIEQWDLALAYDKGNALVINKLAKAVDELDYLINEHFKNGKMHLKYSRLKQAESDFTIVVELTRDKKDARYLDALEQLEWIKKQ